MTLMTCIRTALACKFAWCSHGAPHSCLGRTRCSTRPCALTSPPPRRIESFVHWLKFYKSEAGIINKFGFGGTAQSREYAEHIIEECHSFWKELIADKGQQPVLD